MGVAPYSDAALEREASIVRGARLRALWLWSALAAGIALAPATLEIRHIPSAAGFGVAAGFLIGALLTRRWACRGLLTLAVVCMGWALHTQRAAEIPATSIGPVIAERAGHSPVGGAIMTFRAVVLDTPRIVEPKVSALGAMGFAQPVTRFRVQVSALADDPLTTRGGTLWVRIDDASVPLARAGDVVDVTGMARPIARASNPGEFDLATWAVAHDVAGTLTLSNASLVRVVSGPTAPLARLQQRLTSWHADLRDRAASTLRQATAHTPEPARSMVHALILGESPRDDSLSSAFLHLGLAHVLAISGFHLIIMSRLTLFLVRLTGDRGWIEPVIVALLVVGYMLIVPAGAPVLRSGFLALTLLIADALGRRFDRGVLLILISIALLLVDPIDLWSLGYQLSCGLTLLLVCCARAATENIFGMTLRGVAPQRLSLAAWIIKTFKQGAAGLVGSTLLCWLASLPLIAFRTALISPLTLIATVLVVPPITLLLWLAFLALGVGLVVPQTTTIAAPILAVTAQAIAWLVLLLDQVPLASVRITRPDLLWAIAATVLAIVWLIKGHPRHVRYWAALGLLVIWFAGRWAGVHVLPYRTTPIKVDMLDVGDGTCILLRAERTAVLWDAGSLRPGLGGDTIARALTELNVPSLDAIIISHPDVDHFGGVPELLRTFSTHQFFTSDHFSRQALQTPGGTASRLQEMIIDHVPHHRNHTIAAGQSFTVRALHFNVLSPPSPPSAWANDNEHSLVLFVHTGSIPAILLTGDAGPLALGALLHPDARARLPRSLVLELPHHGSFNPQAEELVRLLDPALILQSTGPRRLNNPAWESVRRTLQGVRPWMITAHDGAIWVDFSRDGTLRRGSVLGREPR